MKTDSELLSAAFRISAIVTPAFAAADVAAPLTEFTLNMPVWIPVFSRSHLGKVEELTGLCGFTTARINLVTTYRNLSRVSL